MNFVFTNEVLDNAAYAVYTFQHHDGGQVSVTVPASQLWSLGFPSTVPQVAQVLGAVQVASTQVCSWGGWVGTVVGWVSCGFVGVCPCVAAGSVGTV
jgi:hypothetical protein